MTTTELRPLSLGELLDRAFSYYRKHFWLFVGIMALPQAVLACSRLILVPFQMTGMTDTASQAQDPGKVAAQVSTFLTGFLISFSVLMIISVLVYSVALGATTSALSDVYMGRTTSISAAFRSLRGKILRLFDVVVSIVLRVMGIYFLFAFSIIVVIAVPAAFLGFRGGRSPLLIIIFGFIVILAVLAGIFFAILLILRYALAVPALIIENLKARDAIKRSVTLAKGNLWKIFLTAVLMYIINIVVASIFQGPFWLAMIFMSVKSQAFPLWLEVPMYLSAGVGGALSGPLFVIALALLYYDARVRKEGFDLQLMMAGLHEGEAPASIPRATISPDPAGK